MSPAPQPGPGVLRGFPPDRSTPAPPHPSPPITSAYLWVATVLLQTRGDHARLGGSWV
jgi:hypothetical protein